MSPANVPAADLHPFFATRLYAGRSPIWVGILISASLLLLFGALALAFGGMDVFVKREQSAWAYREVRMAVLVAINVGYVPTARHYLALAAHRNFTDLRPLLAPGGPSFEEARAAFCRLDAGALRRASLIGVLIAPITALIVDRDPGLYFREGYWSAETAFAWVFGALTGWLMGSFLYSSLAYARRFSRLAERLRPLDLFDVDAVAPFARQGLLTALLWLLLLSVIAINVVDLLWFAATAAIAVGGAVAGLLLPGQGVHALLRRTKQQEIARINAAIRGDAGALEDSLLGDRGKELRLGDLLAYRAFVDSVREWPLDTSTVVRFALYLAIPLGSWLGGALVERMLGAALD